MRFELLRERERERERREGGRERERESGQSKVVCIAEIVLYMYYSKRCLCWTYISTSIVHHVRKDLSNHAGMASEFFDPLSHEV